MFTILVILYCLKSKYSSIVNNPKNFWTEVSGTETSWTESSRTELSQDWNVLGWIVLDLNKVLWCFQVEIYWIIQTSGIEIIKIKYEWSIFIKIFYNCKRKFEDLWQFWIFYKNWSYIWGITIIVYQKSWT